MGSTRRRNILQRDDYRMEYLIYGVFHNPPGEEGEEDVLGYRDKRWTSLSALEELGGAADALAMPVGTFLQLAVDEHDCFVDGLNASERSGAETQVETQVETQA